MPNATTDATTRASGGPETENLSDLDEQRQASMADEGGAAGAFMESEDLPERERLLGRRSRLSPVIPIAAALGMVGVGLFVWSRVARD